jgi:hypothetical protein
MKQEAQQILLDQKYSGAINVFEEQKKMIKERDDLFAANVNNIIKFPFIPDQNPPASC